MTAVASMQLFKACMTRVALAAGLASLAVVSALAQNVNSATKGNTPNSLPAISINGTEVGTIEVADVNRDGRPDLVIGTFQDAHAFIHNALHVLLGNGDGTFQPEIQYDNLAFGYVLSLRDMDSDGILDIVTADYYGPTFLKGNGDGTFQAPVRLDSLSTQFLLVGDFNGDGKPDVLFGYSTINTSTAINFLAGNGDGSFQSNSQTLVGITVYEALSADFNGDGKADLLGYIRGNNSESIAVLSGNGDGSFVVGQVSECGGRALSLADVNLDGKVDVIGCQAGSGPIVYLGNGDGTFSAQASNLPTYGNNTFQQVADFDGDGIPDLLVVTGYQHQVALLKGVGDGTFQYVASYPTESWGNVFAVGDFDGDGRLDAAMPDYFNNQVRMLFSSKSAVTSFTGTGHTTYGQQVDLSISVAPLVATGPVPTGNVDIEPVFSIQAWDGYEYFGAAMTVPLDPQGKVTYSTHTIDVGTRFYRVRYQGDSNYGANWTPLATQTVDPAPTAIALTSSANPSLFSQAVTFTAQVTSPFIVPIGSVSFYDGNVLLVTLPLDSNGKADFLTPYSLTVGTHSMTASFFAGPTSPTGSPNFLASTSPVFSQQVNFVPPDFNLKASPASVTIKMGQSADITISLEPINGFTGSVAVSCGTLPAGVTCTFNPPALVTDGTKTATTVLTIHTGGATAERAASEAPPFGRPQGGPPDGLGVGHPALTAAWLGGFGLAGLVLCAPRRRRRRAGLILAAGVMTIALTLSSCGGSSMRSTTTTTTPTSSSSTVKVNASAGAGGVSKQLDLTITIVN